ncbi:MAG: hypothetical protein IKV87_03155 [Methanobrevibacter sp.]|nr:hypothetical protein [Methanobrevibacter sp.]
MALNFIFTKISQKISLLKCLGKLKKTLGGCYVFPKEILDCNSGLPAFSIGNLLSYHYSIL